MLLCDGPRECKPFPCVCMSIASLPPLLLLNSPALNRHRENHHLHIYHFPHIRLHIANFW